MPYLHFLEGKKDIHLVDIAKQLAKLNNCEFDGVNHSPFNYDEEQEDTKEYNDDFSIVGEWKNLTKVQETLMEKKLKSGIRYA